MAIEFPHICCGGCVEAVRDAVTAIDGVDSVSVDFDSKICQFTVRHDVELEPQLQELAESRKVFEDWSVVSAADATDRK